MQTILPGRTVSCELCDETQNFYNTVALPVSLQQVQQCEKLRSMTPISVKVILFGIVASAHIHQYDNNKINN